MFAGRDNQVHDALVASGRIAPAALQLVAGKSSEATSLATRLIEHGLVTRSGLLQSVAAFVGGSWVDSLPARMPPALATQIPAELARRFGIVPWKVDGACLYVFALDPLRPELAADLAFALGRPVGLCIGDPTTVAQLWRESYDGAAEPGPTASGSPAATDTLVGIGTSAGEGEAAAVRLVQGVLEQAVRERASDVHFEPFADAFRVRCRIDGALFDLSAPPPAMASAVLSRLKVLANLDIAERRVPQDGRIRLNADGRGIDLRVSTLPTQFGESVVLRVLDPAATQRGLDDLGMSGDLPAAVRRSLAKPSGIFIVTGPTGSGKTTTLYSCLRQLNAADAKILTIEDPVEYEIEGIMQVPVNPAAGLTFAAALRSFLRHDPDVVMVGEIRDPETAQIAIQAALTGHLVLTTLHTNDACGAVTRLSDMGVEPFLLASTIEGVLAQRLVRRNCECCREEYRPSAALLAHRGGRAEDGSFRRGRGCAQCHQSGFSGRLGIFELLRMDEGLRELIGSGVSHRELQDAASQRGMRSLATDGWRLVRAGETTVEELARYV